VIAIISVVGIIVGAALQYLTRHQDGERHHRERRSQAYADYLKAACEQSHLGNQPYPEAHEVLARTSDTRAPA
jgi:hypothetical protein